MTFVFVLNQIQTGKLLELPGNTVEGAQENIGRTYDVASDPAEGWVRWWTWCSDSVRNHLRGTWLWWFGASLCCEFWKIDVMMLMLFWMIDSWFGFCIDFAEDTIKIYEQMLDSNMQRPGQN